MPVPHRKSPTSLKVPGGGPTSSTSKAVQEVALFEYGPITNDQTRLLNIHPRTPDGKITISIRTVSIDELGSLHEYEALSYHRGIGKHEDPIYVQDFSDSGQGKVKAIFVTSNLYTALQHLRMDDLDVPMWVDAICIDQDNMEEKTAQVAKMCEIYRKAERVCIWLGWGNRSFSDAMKFVAEIVGSDTDSIFRDEENMFRWQDLALLMRSEWFSRRWVIQELALAREATVHYGQEQVHWDDFRDTISLFAIHFDTIQSLFEKSKKFHYIPNPIGELDTLSAKVLADFTTNIFRKDRIFEPTIGLEYLVSTLYAFECYDPRDTIFALRNIARETPGLVPAKGYNEPPKPDYKKGLLEVYRDFVGWVFQTSKSLDLICRHWALPERKEGPNSYSISCETLPSWILMVGEGTGGKNGVSFVGPPGRPIYNASHRKDPQFMFEADQSNNATLAKSGSKDDAPTGPNDDAPAQSGSNDDTPAQSGSNDNPPARSGSNDDAPAELNDATLV